MEMEISFFSIYMYILYVYIFILYIYIYRFCLTFHCCDARAECLFERGRMQGPLPLFQFMFSGLLDPVVWGGFTCIIHMTVVRCREIIDVSVSENSGNPKSSILIGFSILNHPSWGYPDFWKYPCKHVLLPLAKKKKHIPGPLVSFTRFCEPTSATWPLFKRGLIVTNS